MSKEGLYLCSEELTDESQFLTSINLLMWKYCQESLHFSFQIKLCMQNMVNVREELRILVCKSK